MRNGRSATVPSSKTVSMCPTSSSVAPPPPSSVPITRSPSLRPAALGIVRSALDRPAARAHPRLAEIGDLVHPFGRVGAAVDVDHLPELGDERVVPARRRDPADAWMSMRLTLAWPPLGEQGDPLTRDGLGAVVDQQGAAIRDRVRSWSTTRARRGAREARRERRVPQRCLGDRARELGRALADAARPRRGRRRRGRRRRGHVRCQPATGSSSPGRCRAAGAGSAFGVRRVDAGTSCTSRRASVAREAQCSPAFSNAARSRPTPW